MRVIITPKEGGKSSEMVRMSIKKQIPILCLYPKQVEFYYQLLETLELDKSKFPDPILLSNIKFVAPDKVLIDDANLMIEALLQEVTGKYVNVPAIAISLDDQKIN